MRVSEGHLPVVGAGEDHAVAHVELRVVDWRRVAIPEVCVPEHSFHPVKLSILFVQNGVLQPLDPGVGVERLWPPAASQGTRARCQVPLEALVVGGSCPLREAGSARRKVTDQTPKIVKLFAAKTRNLTAGHAHGGLVAATYPWKALARGLCLAFIAFA